MLRKWLVYILMAGLLAIPAFLSAAEQETKVPPDAKDLSGNSKTSTASELPSAPPADSYLIGPGDVLEISVWKDEVLNKQPIVRPDGFISFPLIGDVYVAGKTASQLKAEMEKKLVAYVPDIILFVDVRQINSMIIFVIGKVNQPGRFNTNSNVNVMQALATAGGLNVYAKRGSIKIFREEGGKTRMLPFDYDDVVDGKRLDQNIRLKRGDIVVVP